MRITSAELTDSLLFPCKLAKQTRDRLASDRAHSHYPLCDIQRELALLSGKTGTFIILGEFGRLLSTEVAHLVGSKGCPRKVQPVGLGFGTQGGKRPFAAVNGTTDQFWIADVRRQIFVQGFERCRASQMHRFRPSLTSRPIFSLCARIAISELAKAKKTDLDYNSAFGREFRWLFVLNKDWLLNAKPEASC